MKKYNKIISDEMKRILPHHLLGVLCHIIVIYLYFKIPFYIGKILDLLMQPNIDKQLILQQAYWLIFYSAISFIPRTIYRTCYFTISRKSDTYLRKKVVEHLQKVKPEYFEKENKGVFLAYMSKEILSISKILGNFWFYGTKIVFAPIITFLLVCKQINMNLALWLVPIFPIAFIAMCFYYKKLKEKIENSRKIYIELSKNIEQTTEGFLLVKSYNQQKNQTNKFKEINKKMYQADYEIGVVKNKISNVINMVYGFCYIIGFVVGTMYIQKGIITVGTLITFIGYIGTVTADFINGMQSMLDKMPYWKLSLNRFNYFLNLEEYQKQGIELKQIQTIEIKHLSYWYQNETNPVLKDINMKIQKGEKIGIIGEVGSGKTTLVNLITGLYDVPDDRITINGKDINQYSRNSIFSKFNYAVQQNIILDTSIKSNIDVLNHLDEKKLKETIQKAELESDIEKLQERENTLVGEKGTKLSGGQKQRVSIARNLSNIRDINIFDDTLSALDSVTERKIMQTLINDVGENTLIVIANKVSNLKDLDKIYILLKGKIQDYGTHEELLERNEFYQKLDYLERKEETNEIHTEEKC